MLSSRNQDGLGPHGDIGSSPEREPLAFNTQEDKLTPDTAEVVGAIKKLAETLLFHWKTFPIILPASITEQKATQLTSDNGESRGAVNFKDLFKAPTFDELEAVAIDENGKLKRLNQEQLALIKTTGEFNVASLNFKGQNHRWRLSKLLQKGSERSRNSFLGDVARSLSLLVITARDRFCSNTFSLKEAAKGWASGLWNLLDIVIGVPSTSPGDLCQKLHEERMRYLVAELDIKPNLKKELNAYCSYIKSQCQNQLAGSVKPSKPRPPPIPYRYQTPKGQDIDLRLLSKDLMNSSVVILTSILDRQAKGWHIQMRTKLIRHYQGQGLSNEEISQRVTADIMSHYLDKVFTAIANNEELEGLQPGLGTLLVDQAKAVLAMIKAQQNLQRKMDDHKEKLTRHLTETFPIKSRIDAWMKEQMEAFEQSFGRQNLWTAHEEAISLCEEEELAQAVYFLRRDLNFIKEREAILSKELARVKIPTREFSFSSKIWLPHNWIVYQRDQYGRSEIIPTIIKDSQAPKGNSNSAGQSTVYYWAERSVKRMTSTRYPFWRWWNFLQRAWANTWNVIYLLGILVPWCSRLGLRALLWPSAFTPDLELSQVDGSFYPRMSSHTHSLVSRLRALWANVASSRAAFEAAPDTGFLGKSMTRHFNRLWNYVLKGAVGSVITVLVMPVACVATSTLSLLAAVLSPLWVPAVTLIAHFFFFLVWDLDCPRSGKNRLSLLCEALVWNLLLQGCLQPLAALLVGTVVCPLTAIIGFLFAGLRFCLRRAWDVLMFQLVIKSRGRVPSSNGFVARRIAGPGLASNYFFQIRPEQALAAVEARAEHDELMAWQKNVMAVIETPRDMYRASSKARGLGWPGSALLALLGVPAASQAKGR
ncbi:Gmk_2 protein [Elysia marginata]|uniref:Gmk_2 protein n=1 Tax=Elysia marginata TaxID=1093978 RepID=A0AAV4IZK1_9GAST|nr:Gmk_2 protein [Elysia marginata]